MWLFAEMIAKTLLCGFYEVHLSWNSWLACMYRGHNQVTIGVLHVDHSYTNVPGAPYFPQLEFI